MPMFEYLILVLTLIFAHNVDSKRSIEETNGHAVVAFALAAGGVLLATLVIFPSRRGTVLYLIAALPAGTACVLRLLHCRVRQADSVSYWRLVLSWGTVVAAFGILMQRFGIDTSERFRNLVGFVVGHLALMPRVSVAGTGVSEATKVKGFVLALIAGAFLQYAFERLSPSEDDADSPEARARRAEDRAAHHKQALLDQSAELAEALSQLAEVRHTCNALIQDNVELHGRQRVLADFIEGTAPLHGLTAEVRAALQDSEDDARAVQE